MKKSLKKKIKKKKFRLKLRFVFFLLFSVTLFGLSIYYLLNLKISNIYISGNNYLTDQQIIELAHIQNYPSTLKNSSSKIKKKLEKNFYVKEAKIYKKSLTQIYINIEENRPLFYNVATTKTILLDGNETTDKFNIPTLTNNVPSIMYDKFVEKMSKISVDILNKISEIKYDPDEVDEQRFLFSMTDLNYVYLTLNKLEKINNYNNIVQQFDNKKGVLYLNSGGYFEIAK